MKERLFSLFVLLVSGFMPSLADTVLMMLLADSTEVVCALDNQPQMQFAQDSVTLTCTNGLVGEWNFTEVASWHFAETTTTAEVHPGQEQIRIEEGKIIISGSNAKKVAVYDVSGRLITTRTLADNAVSLDLSGFTAGVYVLTAGESSVKFFIR